MSHLQSAIDQLNSYGLQVSTLDTSGKLVRVKVDTDKGAKKSGWYVAHEFNLRDGRVVVVGRYGNWKLSDETHKFEADYRFSDDDIAAYKQKLAADKARVDKERKRVNADAVKRAETLANSLTSSNTSEQNTAYMARKRIQGHWVYYGKGDTLFVPVMQHERGLVGFQIINPDGSKKFLTGTEIKGGYHIVGTPEKSDVLLIAEGYATAASLYEATGYACFVAYHAGNLLPVAQMVRQRWPEKKILLCADDDHATDGNPGIRKATNAAEAVGGYLIKPSFLDKSGCTDFNDMAIEQGYAAVKTCIDDQLNNTKPLSTPQQASPPDTDWMDRLVRNRDGLVIGNVFNVSLILSQHKDWQGVLARDEFSARIVARREAPFRGGDNYAWSDNHDTRTASWLIEHMSCTPRTQTVIEAVQVVAEDNTFHPVREYLHSTPWDGTPRVENFFIEYFGACPPLSDDYTDEDREKFNSQIKYLQLVGKKFLVSAVARVMRPGCKVDTVLILEGKQGLKKSTSMKVLAGDWFTDTPFNLGDKDAFQSISGKWIIELAELDSFNKSESTRAKAFFSSSTDNYRPAYGRRNQDYPRQCVFVGTTNQHEYLRDASGNRRYWPVECLDIDLKAIKRDRDQIWAEALHLYNQGVLWWPTAEEMPLFEQEQSSRQIDDPWQLMIEQYLEEPERKLSQEKITINELLSDCIRIEKSRIGERAEAIRVGRCLASLGYIKRRQAAGKSPRTWYEKCDER